MPVRIRVSCSILQEMDMGQDRSNFPLPFHWRVREKWMRALACWFARDSSTGLDSEARINLHPPLYFVPLELIFHLIQQMAGVATTKSMHWNDWLKLSKMQPNREEKMYVTCRMLLTRERKNINILIVRRVTPFDVTLVHSFTQFTLTMQHFLTFCCCISRLSSLSAL